MEARELLSQVWDERNIWSQLKKEFMHKGVFLEGMDVLLKTFHLQKMKLWIYPNPVIVSLTVFIDSINFCQMWLCPKCKRRFRYVNQMHTCKQITPEEAFKQRPRHLFVLYSRLLDTLTKFGEFRVEAIPSGVLFFKTKSTFLAIKVKSSWLDLEFFLDKVEDLPPVKKYLRTSRKRVLHVVSIDQEEDIDAQLLRWLQRSYELITSA